MDRNIHQCRRKWRGILVILSMGLLLVPAIFAQGMEREEWRSQFKATFRVGTEGVPAFVLRRMENLLAGLEQEGWSQGLDPSRVAGEAASLARRFDEDLRKGASPVLAGLLYRQMSGSLSLGEEEEKESRNLAFEKLRDRVKDRNSAKEKDRTRLSSSKRKPRPSSSVPDTPGGGPGGPGARESRSQE